MQTARAFSTWQSDEQIPLLSARQEGRIKGLLECEERGDLFFLGMAYGVYGFWIENIFDEFQARKNLNGPVAAHYHEQCWQKLFPHFFKNAIPFERGATISGMTLLALLVSFEVMEKAKRHVDYLVTVRREEGEEEACESHFEKAYLLFEKTRDRLIQLIKSGENGEGSLLLLNEMMIKVASQLFVIEIQEAHVHSARSFLNVGGYSEELTRIGEKASLLCSFQGSNG